MAYLIPNKTKITAYSSPWEFLNNLKSKNKRSSTSYTAYNETHVTSSANKPSSALKTIRSKQDSDKTMRPPCRQSENLFHLEDNDIRLPSKKFIRIIRKQILPPSRHIIPPKTVNLKSELPESMKPLDRLSATQPIKLAPVAEASNYRVGSMKSARAAQTYRNPQTSKIAEPRPNKQDFLSPFIKNEKSIKQSRSISRGKPLSMQINNFDPELLDL